MVQPWARVLWSAAYRFCGSTPRLEGLTDPLGVVPDGQGIGCLLFNDCYVKAGPMA